MAEFDEKVKKTTEEIERLKKAIEEAKETIKSYEDMNRFSGGGYEDIINEEIRSLQVLNKELDKAKEKFDNITKIDRGNGHKVKANYENAVLGVEYERQKNSGVLSAEREYEILEQYYKKMHEGTNDSIKTARRMQEVMDRIDYSSAIRRALPSVEKYNALVDKFIQKNGKITDKDRLGIAQDLLSKTNSRSRDYFALNTIASKLQQKISLANETKGLNNTEVQRAEQEQTRIAQQQAQERIRIAQEEHKKKMQFFDNEYIYNNKKYSTSNQLDYFTKYANNIKNSNNFIGMPNIQTQQYEQAMHKVRGLQEQLENENKKSVENIKNKVQEACKFIISAVSKAIDIVKWAISSVGKVANGIIGVFRSVGSIASRIIGLLGNFANRVRDCTKTTNLLKGSWTELNSAINVVSSVVNKLTNNSFINEGKKLLSSIETLNTLIGKDLTQSTIDWANNLEKAFGIDAAGLVADMREVAGVLKGLGMSMDDTATAAQNLVSVGQTMSSVIGLDTETVMNKIYSGMRGMTQAIDDIGLSVREAQMNSFLKKLKAQGGEFANIGTSFSSLTEQQRIYVRYAALMDQFMSVYTPEAYAKSLDSITGRLNILTQRLRALKQLIGNFAIQVFSKFAMPFTYAIDVVTEKLKGLFSNLLKWMGLNPKDLDLSTGMNHTTVSAEDLAGAYDDVADSAKKASDASKKASGGLDDWDHVSTIGSSGTSSSDIADNFDYSKLMDLDKNYAKQLEKLAKVQDNYSKKLKKSWDKLLNSIKNKFNNWYTGVTGRKFDAGFNLKLNWKQIKDIAKNIVKIFKEAFSTISALFVMIIDDTDFGKIITKVLRIVENITAIISKAIHKISPYIIEFYDKYISPYMIKIGKLINDVLDKAINKVNEWRQFWESGDSDKWLAENKDTKFDKINKTIDSIINKIKIVCALGETLFTGKTSDKNQKLFDNSDNADILNNTADVLFNIHEIISGIAVIVKDIGIDFKNWLATDGLKDIKKLAERIKTIISNHKEDIEKIIDTLGKVAWDVMITLANKIIDICDWAVNNSDAVCSTIKTIGSVIKGIVDNIGLIIASGIFAKIAMAATKFTLISKLVKSITRATAAGTAGTAGAAGAAGAGATIKTLGIASLPIAAGSAVAYMSHLGKQFKAFFKNGKVAIKNLSYNGNGFSAEDINNQARLSAIKLKEQYGKITKEQTDNIASAYRNNLVNSGVPKEQARIYAESFKASLDYYMTQSKTSLKIDLDTKKTENQLNGFTDHFDDIINGTTRNANSKLDKTSKKAKSTSKNVSSIKKESKNTENSVNRSSNVIKSAVNILKKNINGISMNPIARGLNIAQKAATRSINLIISHVNNLRNRFDSLANVGKSIANGFENKLKTQYGNNVNIKFNNGIKTIGLNTFYANANGGVPKSGSLFLANENGNSELVGNFGGYTGVANQGMIMQAMENAIARGMSRANTGNGKTGNTIIEVCKGGMFVGDNTSIRKLANILNSTNIKTNNTIANSAFSMN